MSSNFPSENVGIAFGVVIGAGLSTALGASIVFFPSLVKYANRKTLAGGLGLSAGVMLYVSFVEIFQKSVGSFMDAEFQEHSSYNAATLCFFGGIALMVCLDYLVHGIAHDNYVTEGSSNEAMHARDKKDAKKKAEKKDKSLNGTEESESSYSSDNEEEQETEKGAHQHPPHTIEAPCCAEDPNAQLEDLKDMANSLCENHENANTSWEDLEAGIAEIVKKDVRKKKKNDKKKKEPEKMSPQEERRLVLMSMNTAIAIGLHNFPEGLATFVATLADPAVGAVVAVAIALHNIPEGMCVSLPVYYATGKRFKAFMWGLLSGVSEPLAAILGYLVLARFFSDIVYAILFGLVGGMMVYISIRELIPTAHRYDPEDSVATNCFIFGMGIMALSLLLFVNL